MGMSQIVGPLKFPPPLGTSWGNWINPVVSFEPLSSPCQLTTVLAGATQVDVPINADTGALDCSVGLAGARITILSFATATYCQLLFWVAFSFCHVLYMNMYIYIVIAIIFADWSIGVVECCGNTMNCSPLSHTYWFQNTDWSSYNELHWLPIEVKNQSEQRSEPVLVDYNMGLYYPSILYILGIHTIHYGTPTIHFSH